MPIVILTFDEILLAATHGLHRRYNSMIQGRKQREQGRKRSTWDNEIEGACAELAFCKHQGTYWQGLQSVRARDGKLYEVRWTGYENGGLILYPKDKEQDVFVLMDGFAPKYRIVGSLRAVHGKLEKWRKPDGFFLVPRECIRPAREELRFAE